MAVSDSLLQQQNSVQQGLWSGRAARDVDIDRNDAVTAPQDGVGVVVVASPVSTATHRDDPAGLGHLVVQLA